MRSRLKVTDWRIIICSSLVWFDVLPRPPLQQGCRSVGSVFRSRGFLPLQVGFRELFGLVHHYLRCFYDYKR